LTARGSFLYFETRKEPLLKRERRTVFRSGITCGSKGTRKGRKGKKRGT